MTIKKVLIQLNQLGYGGTEKAILSFAQALDRNQYELFLFYWDDRKSAKFYRLKSLSFFLKSAAERFKTLYLQRYSRENQFLRVFKPEHCFSGKLAEFRQCIDKIQPDVIHLNRGEEKDFYTDFIAQINPGIRVVESNIFGKMSHSQYVQRIDQFLFVSQWLREKSPWAGEKARVLYNPILPPQNTNNLRDELNISSKAIVIGRAHRPDLGQDEFLEKVYMPLKEKTETEIVFLSLGSLPAYSDQFQKKYASQIRFLPPTTDETRISQFYNTVDIFTHRRVEGETFGMIIAEAMMHACPVISHRSLMDNAQIEVIGNNQLISDLEDVGEYQSILLRLINNRAEAIELGKALQIRAQKLFSPKPLAQQLQIHYNPS